MAKAINDDVCIKGSSLVIGITFPPIDDSVTFEDLFTSNKIQVKYYIINTSTKYSVSSLTKIDKNSYKFTIKDTTDLIPGVLMVECTATVNGRTEIARCSTGIAIIK